MSKITTLLLLVVLFFSCHPKSLEVPAVEDLSVKWSVIKNLGGKYQCSWEITNQGKTTLGNQGWTLYYNHVVGVPVEGTLPEEVTITQESGTFYSIKPRQGFQLKPEQTIQFGLQCEGAGIKITDAPTGLYMIFEGSSPQLVENYSIGAFTEPQQINRADIDRVPIPTPEVRYKLNESVTLLTAKDFPGIVPTPANLSLRAEGYRLPQDLTIGYVAGLEAEAQMLADKIVTSGHQVTLTDSEVQQADIRLGLQDVGAGRESYRLSITKEGVSIYGSSNSGVFYGTQSLLAWWPLSSWETESSTLLPGVDITDSPRFTYRGMHLDVGRNFHKPQAVKKLLDIMAFYKLNKFHFHLTDDEGWRLAIKGLEELTEVGAVRGHTEDEMDHLLPAYGSGPFPNHPQNHGTGHYSRDEFIEILQYAHARNIEVIPEINFPGHARAAIKAMESRAKRLKADANSNESSFLLHDPQDSSVYKSVQGYDDNVICVCQESVYQFIEYVVSDVVSMYQEAGVPFNIIHTGGDEVPAGIWEKSPACARLLASNPELQDISDLPQYFIRRYHEILEQQDLVTAGWEEIAMHRTQAEVGGEDDPTSSRKIMAPTPEFVNSNFLPYVWLSIWGVAGEDLAYQFANMGYKVVMSNASNLYFDFAYDKDPLEPGFYWAGLVDSRKPFELVPLNVLQTATVDIMGNPLSMDDYEDNVKLTAEGRQNILGIQGQLWSETVKGQDQLEYYIFPKLISLAERAWSPDPPWANYPKKSERLKGLDLAWNRFANGVAQKELPRLDHLWGSVNYRLPPPGAVIEEGLLKANTALPGLHIHYSFNGEDPDQTSPRYSHPVEVPANSTVKLKAYSATGKSSRTSTIMSQPPAQ